MIGRVKGTYAGLATDDTGNTSISFRVEDESVASAIAGELRALPAGKQRVVLQIDAYHKNRTLEQNALLWKLLDVAAKALHCSSRTVYLNMLERYGKYTFIGIRKEAAEEFKRQFREEKEVGTCMLNQTEGVQLQCFYGSSTYTVQEMKVLIEGVFTELAKLGVDVETLSGYRSEWEEVHRK